MNTPSHLIINAALYKAADRKAVSQSALLWGAVMPDIPLVLLSVGFYVYHRWLVAPPMSGFMGQAYDNLYFNNLWWIASHNSLHSPLALSIYLMLLWRQRNQPHLQGYWWFWFVIGCLTHSIIDILTHVNDGPVLFWPLDWHMRFRSIVSYYDPAHFGNQFTIFEFMLDMLLLGYLFLPRLIRRLRRQPTK